MRKQQESQACSASAKEDGLGELVQHFHSGGRQEGASLETKAVRILVAVSLFIHGVCLLLDPAGWFRSQAPIEPEWVIESELMSELPLPVQPEAASKIGPTPNELKPEPPPPVKELLPQLPKKFAVKEEEKPVLPEDEVAKKAEPPAEQAAPDKKEKEKETKPEAPLLSKQDEEATELLKKDLMSRLLKEQMRQEKLDRQAQAEEDKKREAVAKKLAKLREEAAAKVSTQSIDDSHPYIRAVKGYIYENYSIPEVYNFAETTPPIVLFIVDQQGHLVKMELVQSSKDNALDKYAMQSLEQAAPFFPKPPPEIVGRPIQIRFRRKI